MPDYFNWRIDCIFAEPLSLPGGSKIHASAWYDNSATNRSNPDAAPYLHPTDTTFFRKIQQ